MADFQARQPDYNVAALDKATDCKSNIGATWKQQDGTIRIKLNSFLLINTGAMDLVITLFPVGQPKGQFRKRQDYNREPETQAEEVVPDNIPF